MIYLYYGKIGDGKSYHVTLKELIPAIKQRRRIYTNIEGIFEPQKLKALAEVSGVHVHEIQELVTSWENVSHAQIRTWLVMDEDDTQGLHFELDKESLIILDEAHFVFDAKDFKSASKGFHSFLSYHRHWGLDLVFITQHVKRLDANISRMANSSYQVKNLGFIGGIVQSRYVLQERQTPFDRDIIASYSGKYDKKIFACYKSFKARSGYKRKRKGVLSGVGFIALAACVLFVAYMLVKNGGFSFMHPERIQKSVENANKRNNDNNGRAVRAVYTTPVRGDVAHFPVAGDASPAVVGQGVASLPPAGVGVAPVPVAPVVPPDCFLTGGITAEGFAGQVYNCEGTSRAVVGGRVVSVLRLVSLDAVPLTDAGITALAGAEGVK